MKGSRAKRRADVFGKAKDFFLRFTTKKKTFMVALEVTIKSMNMCSLTTSARLSAQAGFFLNQSCFLTSNDC